MFVANRHVGVKIELSWTERPHCHWYPEQLFEYWMVIWYQYQIGASLIAFVTEIQWIWNIFWVVLQLCCSCVTVVQVKAFYIFYFTLWPFLFFLCFLSITFLPFTERCPLPFSYSWNNYLINQAVHGQRSIDNNLQMVLERFQPKLFVVWFQLLKCKDS